MTFNRPTIQSRSELWRSDLDNRLRAASLLSAVAKPSQTVCVGRFYTVSLVVTGQPGGPGFKAQNNTQTIFTDPDSVHRFQAELIAEHMTAESQQEQVTPDPRRRQLRLAIAK